MYKTPKSCGLNKFKDYPKIIRAYDDQWSTEDGQEKYSSPIARLLKEYIDFVKKNKRKTFAYPCLFFPENIDSSTSKRVELSNIIL
jgi:hypothetical protein